MEKNSAGLGRTEVTLMLLLAACTALAYSRVGSAGFVSLDDPYYVLDNPMVRRGVTAGGLRQAFTTIREGNWHPLTWISHMLDVSLFGLHPLGHHLVSLGLHIANAVLLFLVLGRMTDAVWPSVFAAGLFALHPLRVESVAWVAERKDVLSALFFMLSLGAYVRYTRTRARRAYGALLCCFALGLLAKPMLVTLPFLLLLLDYWPLSRLSLSGGSAAGTIPLRRLLLEKVPLLLLALISSAVTYFAQAVGGAMDNPWSFSLGHRLANAAVSTVRYLGKTLWPVGLGVYYPFPKTIPVWEVAGAVLLLASVTFVVIVFARRWRFLLTGWFWFLGMLVPVSGVVLVGGQAMADRYLYLPGIGLGIIVAWGLWTLAEARRSRTWAGGSAAAILAALAALTVVQTGHWKDSLALYRQALHVAPDNDLIRTNLGVEYSKMGKYEEAQREYARALELNPGYAQAWLNLGLLHGNHGRYADAVNCLTRAVHLRPKSALAHANLGLALELLDRYEEALTHYEEALRLDPDNEAGVNLASVRAKLNRTVR